jgi:hypothetical protein
MIIGSRHRLTSIENSPALTLGESNIKRVFEKKSLGMILDEQLKWDKNNDVQCKIISSKIALLKKRARSFVPRETLIEMYNALVWPHFNYCSTIWNDGSCSIIDKLFKLQKRAARVITVTPVSHAQLFLKQQFARANNWRAISRNACNRNRDFTLPSHAICRC